MPYPIKKTNQNPTPEQMLELAKLTFPDDDLFIEFGKLWARNGVKVREVNMQANHNLMQVVFALFASSNGLYVYEDPKGEWIAKIAVGNFIYSPCICSAKTKQQAILNLAVEVLL